MAENKLIEVGDAVKKGRATDVEKANNKRAIAISKL